MDFTTEPYETLEELDYPDDAGAQVKITKESAGLLKSLKQFVAHQNSQGIQYCENYWTRVTQAQFNPFMTNLKEQDFELFEDAMFSGIKK